LFGSSGVSISSNFSLSDRAASLISLSWVDGAVDLGNDRNSPTLVSFGTASLSTSSLLVVSSGDKLENPVTLPPGFARLVTKPAPTGSAAFAIRMGMEVVALLAGSAAVVHEICISLN